MPDSADRNQVMSHETVSSRVTWTKCAKRAHVRGARVPPATDNQNRREGAQEEPLRLLGKTRHQVWSTAEAYKSRTTLRMSALRKIPG